MNLVADIGNTHIKAAWFSENVLQEALSGVNMSALVELVGKSSNCIVCSTKKIAVPNNVFMMTSKTPMPVNID